jgi:hypothetical protein
VQLVNKEPVSPPAAKYAIRLIASLLIILSGVLAIFSGITPESFALESPVLFFMMSSFKSHNKDNKLS